MSAILLDQRAGLLLFWGVFFLQRIASSLPNTHPPPSVLGGERRTTKRKGRGSRCHPILPRIAQPARCSCHGQCERWMDPQGLRWRGGKMGDDSLGYVRLLVGLGIARLALLCLLACLLRPGSACGYLLGWVLACLRWLSILCSSAPTATLITNRRC